ncbi:MAG: helix-turn-helix domain-containing protein [Sedimenticola sp.]
MGKYFRMPKPQKVHTPERMNRAVDEVLKGRSTYAVGREFDIPETTLRSHARGNYSGFDTAFGRPRCISESEELVIVQYVQYMADRGFPLTKLMVRRLALEVIKKHGRETLINMEKGPSRNWMQAFFKRHPELSARRPHLLDKGRAAITQSQLDQYFDLLEDTLARLQLTDDPTRVFNCDETGFSGTFNSKGQDVIVRKGQRQAFKVQVSITGHVTVNYAISGSGQILPPFLIYSKNLPRASYTDGIPQGWTFASTDSGFITSDLFHKWFTEVFLTNCGKRRPCLLIMDNHVSHLSTQVIDAAKQNGIDLLFFPAHSSHLLQPLDVGYFHVLKTKVVELATGLGYAGTHTLPRHLFPKLLHHAMNKISPATIAASFAATGISPLKKTAVRALTGPANTQTTASTTAPTPSTSGQPGPSNTCSQCGHTDTGPNMLVKIGMVPESLANIFVEPPPVVTKKRKNTIPAARVFLSDQTAHKKTRPDVTQERTSDPQQPQAQNPSDDVLCVICMTAREDLFWVGCDGCDAWIHYECLPSCEQTDVDVSLVCHTTWFCNACRTEE